MVKKKKKKSETFSEKLLQFYHNFTILENQLVKWNSLKPGLEKHDLKSVLLWCPSHKSTMSDIYKSKLSSNSSLVYDIRQSLSFHKTAGLCSHCQTFTSINCESMLFGATRVSHSKAMVKNKWKYLTADRCQRVYNTEYHQIAASLLSWSDLKPIEISCFLNSGITHSSHMSSGALI